jgi:hypothetical protein
MTAGLVISADAVDLRLEPAILREGWILVELYLVYRSAVP